MVAGYLGSLGATDVSRMNPVFVFVDLLEDFFSKPPLSQRRGPISIAVNDLASFARENDFPVIWVRQVFEPDLSEHFDRCARPAHELLSAERQAATS